MNLDDARTVLRGTMNRLTPLGSTGIFNQRIVRQALFGPSGVSNHLGQPKGGFPMCSVEGCEAARYAKGFCATHYKRFLRHGDASIVKRDFSKTLDQRFWEKVSKSEGCWEWQGSVGTGGYGKISLQQSRKIVLAHRVSWTLHFGDIPDGMLVCHRCDNPPCVRPDHLFLGDTKANADDMVRKGRHRSGMSLTAEEVKEIIDSPGPAKNIAHRFGVSLNTVHRYRRGEGGVSAWKMQ